MSSEAIMRYMNLLLALFLFGVVDQVDGNSVTAEIAGPDHKAENTIFPLWMFPCDVQEGDKFYVIKSTNVLEIRCGEPPA